MRYRCYLTSPAGQELEITELQEIASLGTISLAPESDLTILTHGEMTLSLDNSDGIVEDFFSGAAPNDLYEVVLEGEREDGFGWDRLFAGVLDLPYSLRYVDETKTASVTAYSFTKALERTPATPIARTIAGKTVSINSGTTVLSFLAGSTEAADLEVGDAIRVDDGAGTTEDFVVDRVIDSDSAKTVDPASSTFSNSFAEVTSPFYHDRTPGDLLQLIADASGVALSSRDPSEPLADFPIATPVSLANLNFRGVPVSVVADEATIATVLTKVISSTWKSAYGTVRKLSADPTEAWIDGATSNLCQFDWTPYYLTKPATIRVGGAGQSDTGRDGRCADHVGGFTYEVDYFSNSVHLLRNGADLGVFSTAPTFPTSVNDVVRAAEFDPITGRVFLSYHSPTMIQPRKLRYYDGTFHDIDMTTSGWLRCVRYFNTTLMLMVDSVTNDLKFYDPALVFGNLPTHVISWENATDRILHWTARAWGVGATLGGVPSKKWFSFLFERAGATWLALFDTDGMGVEEWTLVTTYRVSASTSLQDGTEKSCARTRFAFQTVLTRVSGEEVAVGFAGNVWFVLAPYFAGVIRYADFGDCSCAKAARDLAVVINGLVNIDQFKLMSVLNRRTLGSGPIVASLGVPAKSTRQPFSELYRSNVVVTGEGEGGSIEESQGDTSDSARRVEISSRFVTTTGLALATALAALTFVSQIREQRDVAIIDDATGGLLISLFDRVELDGREWVVYKMDLDLETRVFELTVLEVST